MPQTTPPARLDLTRLDDRALPSSVTLTTVAKPFDFTAAGTLTAQEQTTADGSTLSSSATTAVTVKGSLAYASNTAGTSGGVSVAGTGVLGQFKFQDADGTATTTDPLAGTGKGLTPAVGAEARPFSQALAGTFNVSTFELKLGWSDPNATVPTSGTLTATLAPKTPQVADLLFGDKSAARAADGTYGLDFTAVLSGDPVRAATRTTAVARATATWTGGGQSSTVELDVPLYWNTASVKADVVGLTPPEWADKLTVTLDAAGQLAEADETNNSWTVDIAEPVVTPPVTEVTPPVVVPPVVPLPPVAPPNALPLAVPTGFRVGDDGTVEWRDGVGAVIGTARPFGDYAGPLTVAAGDVNDDGVIDAVVAAGEGGGPRVHVLDGRTGGTLASFFAYDMDFRGGVSVAAADVNDDGRADIVTGAGAGGGPIVRVFDGRTTGMVNQFVAYDMEFRGGVAVAAVDLDGDERAEVLTTPGAGGGPLLQVFDPTTGALRFATYGAPPDSREPVKLEVALDPVGGVVLYARTGGEGGTESPARRLHSQLTADGPLLTDLDVIAEVASA